MNIEKLASGKYRIRQDYNCKTYRVTVDYKPTKREATQLIQEKILEDNLQYDKLTFAAACEEYMKIKSNVLAPSTKKGYVSVMKQFSDRFNKLRINAIKQPDIQKEINDYAASHSPKSVANMHGFISAVLKEFRPAMQLYTKLPQKEMNKGGYVPTYEEVQAVLQELEGTKHKIAIGLAICGLRRSEICGIKKCDLDENNILHICRSYTQGEDKKWYLREMNKTDTSTRLVQIPADLANEIRDMNTKERIYDYAPNTIYDNLVYVQKKLGLPHFRLHSLRAFYASYLHSINVPDAYIQKSGGWKSDYVMKSVYRRALDDVQKEMMYKSASEIGKLF